MFGSIGGPELVAIFVLALLLFGPRKLPEIGRTIGRALAEFRGVTSELRSNLEREVDVEELRRTEREVRAVAQEARRAPRELTEPRGTLAPRAEPAGPDGSDDETDRAQP